MSTNAEIAGILPDLLSGVVMVWTFLSVVRIIVFDSSCDPQTRPGWGLRSLTDPLPWAITGAYGRITGDSPPTWLPWIVAYAVYFFAVCLCDLAIDHLVELAN